jgi:hypothetical protein
MENISQTCENCKATVRQQTDKCPSCGFPIGGTEVQKEIYYNQLGSRKDFLKQAQEKIYTARVILWVIAGLSFLYGLINYFASSDSDTRILILIINVLMGGIFLLLSSYALDKPFVALILAVILYIGFFIYGIVDGSITGGYGLFGRIVIIGFLIKGASSARDAEELKKELDKGQRK